MKILKLSLKNIASFRNDIPFVLDFTTAPLSQHSLFLITGSTGAGKSTILDAITVALYDKYHRSDSSKNLLSQLATDASIELEYEKDGTQYRNVWRIKRARNKIDGNIQDVEMQLSYVNNSELIASKKTDVIHKTKEILGLDFQQFTKTIILPQGEFAKFLHSEEKVKVALFEKITNTEKYREFSMSVFNRNKIEEETLSKLMEKIGNSEPLNDVDEQNLIEEIHILRDKIKLLKDDITDINTKNQQLKFIQDVTSSIQSIETQLNEMIAQKNYFETLEESISRAENANEILSIIQEIKQQTTRLTEKKIELKQKQNLKSDLEIEIDHSSKELDNISESYKKLKELVGDLYDKLPLYREVSANIHLLSTSIVREENEGKKLQEELNGNRQKQLEINEDIVKKSTQKYEIEHTLQELSHLESAQVHIERLKSYLKDIQNIQKDMDTLLHSIDSFHSEINGKLQENLELESNIQVNESKKLSHTIYVDSTLYRYEQLKDFCSLFEILLSKKSEQKTIEKLINSLKESFQFSKNEYAKTALEFDANKEEISKVSQQISLLNLELTLHQYRTQLFDGQPCPLCGSLEHSYTENHLVSIDALQKNIESLHEQYSTLESSKSALQKSLHNEEQLQQQHTDSIEEKQRNLITISEEIQLDLIELQKLPFPVDEETFTTIQAEILARDNNKFLQFQIESDTVLFKRNIDDIAKLNDKIKDGKLQIELKTKEIENSTNSINDIKKGYNIPQELSTVAFIQEVETMFNEYKFVKDDATKLHQNIAVLTSRLKSLEEENEKQSKKNIELESSIKENKSQLAVESEKKISLFVNSDIETKHQEAHKDLQTSFTHLQSYEKQHRAKIEVLNTIDNKISIITYEITSYIEPAIEELSKKKSLLVTNYKFKNDEEIYSSAIDEESLQNKKNNLLDYKQTLANLEYDKLQKSSELELALQTKPTETIEELQSILSDFETQQTETTLTLGAKKLLFEQNNALKVQYEQYKKEYEHQKHISHRWNKLNQFIGSSDGTKYQKIVQRITMTQLLQYTNNHLREFTNRYTIALHTSEQHSLDLFIIDTENNFKQREVTTLSGGETFLVSLSMALGIATMISNATEIESLFLDEGFGTLDQNTLEFVMIALENLQQKGRKIGIISHVELLKERISTQIVVEAIGNGSSKVYVRKK